MALSVKIQWRKAIALGAKGAFQKNLVKMVPSLPTDPGIYVFGRKHGNKIVPIYIGQASKGFRSRLKQQSNNLALMEGVKAEKNGERVLLLGVVQVAQKQILTRVLDVAEQAHIEHALTEGHPILNIRGTKAKRHEVSIDGQKSQAHPFPRTMFLAVKKNAS
jgi:hypothetical protein